MDSDTGAGLIGLAMGAFFFVYGVLFRTGILQANFARQYRDQTLPTFQRNAGFAFIPIGVGFIAGGVFLVVNHSAAFGLSLAALAVSVVGVGFSLVVLARPPWWMKPRWLREAEADEWRHYTRPPFRLAREAAMVTSIVLVFGGAFVFILLRGTPTEVAGAVMTGLGAAGLFFVRRRRKT